MDWVKLTTNYYRDLAVAVGSDAAEVMFTRGIALVGETESGGFIPTVMIGNLTRKPAQATRVAGELVQAQLWEEEPTGYRIRNWHLIQEELERYAEKKRRDRDRKRAVRASSTPTSDLLSTDVSADSPAPRPTDRLLDQELDAAAAARRPRHPGTLPIAVDILRGALEAHKFTVRWDILTADELTEIETLREIHGDGPLVRSALQQHQPNKPAATARAWLAGWRELRRPGDLGVIADPCTAPGHTGTVRHCVQCASEQKAAAS